LKNFLMIVVCVLLGVCGQLLMKQGISYGPNASAKGDAVDDMGEIVPYLRAVAMNPLVIGGFALYGLSSVLWLILLTRVELSWAYPMLAMGYIAVVFLSRIFFQEAVTMTRFAGTVVVAVGVWLISRT